jgi:hypothetical protein
LGTTDIAPEADALLPVEADVSAPVVALDGLMASSTIGCLHMMIVWLKLQCLRNNTCSYE